MASQNLKQRSKDEPTTTTTTTTTTNNNNNKAKKRALAKRGLKSLAIAIAIPATLTIFTIYLFGLTRGVKPFYNPPLWAIHLASILSSCLMSLSSWLVWAEGGFHRQHMALPLYMAQFVLGLLWAPTVFWLDAKRMGLVICVAHFVVLYRCSQCFRHVNPIAGDLVKLCLAWVAFLGIINYKLL
ncbi:translocator protein homolog [Tasmannia lanceolata]|uniref:translocator protein homolog n=1 Tax=Tasmannia lanceolata TaxID=3420 RepID=UPI0040640F37